jgi:hypothetical protein
LAIWLKPVARLLQMSLISRSTRPSHGCKSRTKSPKIFASTPPSWSYANTAKSSLWSHLTSSLHRTNLNPRQKNKLTILMFF